VLLELGSLRSETGFEAVAPPLPAGDYNLRVINPDEQFTSAIRAYKAIGTPTISPTPRAEVTPDHIEFVTPQPIGVTSPPRSTTLINVGTADLIVNEPALSGEHPGDFNYISHCPRTLSAGSSCAIDLTFTPTISGSRTATLVITSNAADSPHNVLLSGIGVLNKPDLIITLLRVAGPVTFNTDNGFYYIRVPVLAIVKNQGSAAVSNAFEVWIADDNSHASFDVTATIPPGNDTPVSGTATFIRNSTDSFNIKAIADACGGPQSIAVAALCFVDESNEDNNESSLVRVLIPTPTDPPTSEPPAALPDLLVSNFSADTSENGTNVSVEIFNQGNSIAKFFTVHLFDNSGTTPTVRCNWTLDSLAPQQKVMKTCDDNTTAFTESYSVEVDVFDEVIESNDANNTYPIFN
jgi:hypothetical protein